MSRIPVLSGTEVVKALERAGYKQVRQRGSHVTMRNTDTGRGVTVPLHKTVKRGTLAAILRQVQMDPDDFRALL